MSRYERQETLPEIGVKGQARLAGARVLVIGAGGLAAPALPLLAGAGVGHLTIIDPDTVDLSNLHRQTLFTEADCGRAKAEMAAKRCASCNSAVEIDYQVTALTPVNAPELVAAADIVLDCADSYAVSYILSDECRAAQTPLISASVLGTEGYVGGFCGRAPSLRAVFPEAPQNSASCASAGVIGPVVGMLGAAQAQMVLTHLLGMSPSPLGLMMQMDGRSFQSRSFRFDSAPEPEDMFAFASIAALTEDDIIVDLRGSDEAPEPIHPDALRIAPQTLARDLPLRTGRLVLCCATGLRAWRAAEDLYPNWPGEIALVAASAT